MTAKPLAVYVSPGYAPWLDSFPARVETLSPAPGIVDLPALLAERGLKPDLVIQDETLAPRVLLKGLETLDCPKIFWSMDPHLNHAWQAHYARLFDAVACTQRAWREPLRHAGCQRVEWIPWAGVAAPFRPYAQRTDKALFVGRISPHRALRRLFAEHLSAGFAMRVKTDIAHHDVQEAYAQAWLAPNESIQGEINERLFTAAGAGCLVLDPDAPNGLEELFEPGREVLRYRHALELDALMAHALAHPKETERMGRAARERVAHEHQPGHRLAALGRLALCAPQAGLRGTQGEAAFWLAAGRCLEGGLLAAPPEEVVQGLARFQEDPACLTTILALLAAGGQQREALQLAARFCAAGFAPADAPFQSAACALALRAGEFSLATRLYQAFASSSRAPEKTADTPATLYALLAKTLLRQGIRWRPGFPYDPDRHLPATAFEFLDAALTLSPGNELLLRRMETLLRDLPGSALYRLGYLSELSLRNREDFRLGLSLALAGLKAFRPAQALEELALARRHAAEQGKAALFERLLASCDPDGSIRAAALPPC